MAIANSNSALGIDIACVTDLDPHFRLVSGARNVGNALARWLQTPRGSVWYAPDRGFDLLQFANCDVDQSLIFRCRAGVIAEAKKDPRVLSVDVKVSWDETAETLTVTIRGKTAYGTFDLIASVKDVVSIFLKAA